MKSYMSKSITRRPEMKLPIYKSSGILAAIMLILMAPLLLTTSLAVRAQNNGNGEPISVSIRVAATVQATTDMEVSIVTLRDMFLDRQITRQGIITIDPLTDVQAGQMRAEGRPNSEVRISFLQERELTRIGGSETIMFYYDIAGNDIDDQPSAEVLDLDNRDFRLNEDGEFYFWIGGRVDIRNAVQGSYDGEFTVEIEYL